MNRCEEVLMRQTLADAETIRISRMYAGLWDVD